MGYGRGQDYGGGEGHGHGGSERVRGMGPGGYCICLRCGYRAPKQPGVPCRNIRCPNCGAVMIREGSHHHQLFLEKTRSKGPGSQQ